MAAKKDEYIRISINSLKQNIQYLIVVVALIMAAFYVGGLIRDARYDTKYPMPGVLVDAGGHQLHLYCTGEGSPTVILEADWRQWSIFLTDTQASMASRFRTCVYDRAGYGWSEPGPTPRTSGQMVQELHLILENAGEEGPFVIVGFGYGGWNALSFANRYPTDTAGVMIVDTPFPDYLNVLPGEDYEDYLKSVYQQSYWKHFWSRLGFPVRVPEAAFPVDEAIYKGAMRLPRTHTAIRQEYTAHEGSLVYIEEMPQLETPLFILYTGLVLNPDYMPRDFPVGFHNITWRQNQDLWDGVAISTRRYAAPDEFGGYYRANPGLLSDRIADLIGQ